MTLAEMRLSARSKADEESGGFISDTELNRYLNQGLRMIYGKIVQRFDNYFVIVGTSGNGGLFSTVANQQVYTLPTGMLKLVRVEYRSSGSVNDNDWRRVPTINIASDAGSAYFPIREGYLPQFGYFLTGAGISFKPVPAQAYSIRLWTIPHVTLMTADTDVPGVPDEYQELVAEYGSLQCLRKSGEPLFTTAQNLFQLELMNMLDNVNFRDQQPEQMTITEGWDTYRYGW